MHCTVLRQEFDWNVGLRQLHCQSVVEQLGIVRIDLLFMCWLDQHLSDGFASQMRLPQRKSQRPSLTLFACCLMIIACFAAIPVTFAVLIL